MKEEQEASQGLCEGGVRGKLLNALIMGRVVASTWVCGGFDQIQL